MYKRNYIFAFLFLFLLTLFINIPIILNNNLLLGRGNDLQEQFWPVFYFIKQQILINHQLPLWNSLWFSGLPLLPDPQFPLFYPPHIIFLILPTNEAFTVSIILHIFMGGIGAYLASKIGFKFSASTSLFIGSLYILSPRLAGYLEAGHFGLVATTAWIPFIILSLILLSRKPNIKWSIILAFGLAGTFYTHTLIFLTMLVFGTLFFFINLFFIGKVSKIWKFSILYIILGYLLTFGLTAITLLPQLEWAPQTTRFLLLQDRDVYPKWLSFQEFIQTIFLPWSYPGGISQIDSEKWLALGIIPVILSIIGFLFLSKKLKLVLIFVGIVILIIILNNISPFYKTLLSQDWYALMRVSTRIWPVVMVAAIFLAGFGFERLQAKFKNKKVILLISVLTFVELTGLFWSRILIPIPLNNRLAPKQVYEFLKQDNDIFRVFCVNRCLSQQKAAIYNLQLVEGYNTLQQNNYYRQSWQLTGKYWDYYTLSIPPIGIYTFEKIQPDALYLGLLNTKYIIAPYQIVDKNLILKKQVDKYYIYQNNLFAPRAFMGKSLIEISSPAKLLKLTPNHIKVEIPDNQTPHLVLSEVYSPGWKAYLNDTEEVDIQERPDTLRLVDIKKNTKYVDFYYRPQAFEIGWKITLITILMISYLLVNSFRKLKHNG